MKINEANVIFNISQEELGNMDTNDLKKIYKKLALKYHPDKNNNSDVSKEHFQNIALAYDTLHIYIESVQDNNMNRGKSSFLDKIFVNINMFYSKHAGLVKNIIEMYNDKILLHLEKTIWDMSDIELYRLKTLIENENIVQYLSKDIKTLIEREIKIRNQEQDPNIIEKNDQDQDQDQDQEANIIEKIEEDQYVSTNVYKNTSKNSKNNIMKKHISASIDDIIDNNVHIIEYKNKKIFIPLWHSELTYEVGDDEVLNIYIEPNIPTNMYLDEYNNLHVYITKDFSNSLLFCDVLDFEIGSKTFHYNIRDIKIEKTQQIKLWKQGPPLINEHNMFAVSHRASIIIHLEFK